MAPRVQTAAVGRKMHRGRIAAVAAAAATAVVVGTAARATFSVAFASAPQPGHSAPMAVASVEEVAVVAWPRARATRVVQPLGRRGSGRPAASTRGRASAAATAAAAAGSDTQAEARRLFDWVFKGDGRPVVLYDGVCNMCNSAVNLALRSDPEAKKLRFAALQSTTGRGLLQFCGRSADDISSMVVVTSDGKYFLKSEAALFVGKELETNPLVKGVSTAASWLLPKGLRDVAYDGIATNRYNVLGKRQEMRSQEDGAGDGAAGRFVPEPPADLWGSFSAAAVA
mmetsp:Transcript_100048/g.264414  ORF Transcript_100048/g.264414 Transcript_100048/m.264414 type:complete len:284 (-) Transcript_100048:143-994(-)